MKTKLIALMFFFCWQLFAIAGVNSWESHGPEGGAMTSIALDPNNSSILYATSNGGVFKSTNEGESWVPVNNGLSELLARKIAPHPTNSAILYSTFINNGGVFRTSNTGASWTARSNGISTLSTNDIAIDPSTPQVLYAATAGGGVFKTTDEGASWVASNTGLANLNIQRLALDSSLPSTLFAGTSGGGVFKSTNGGTNWAASNTGLTNLTVNTLLIDPTSTSTLYAGTNGGKVFKTTNGGANWAASSTGIGSNFVFSMALDPANTLNIYAGTTSFSAETGLYKTTDGGANWAEVHSGGLPRISTNAIAVKPGTNVVFAGTQGGGLFKSTNGGSTWNAANTSLFSQNIFGLAVDALNPQNVYAIGNGGGVMKSANGSLSWSEINTGIINRTGFVVAVDPTSSAVLYAGTSGGVHKSTDGGTNWAPSNTGVTNQNDRDFAIDPTNPSIVYLATSGGGVFKTVNAAGNWAASNTGLTNLSVNALAMDPASPATLYAATANGIFQTTNFAANWSSINGNLPNLVITDVAIDGAELYVATGGSSPSGVFKSTNGGTSWTAVNTGLTTNTVRAIVVDPLNNGTIYVSTPAGVFRTINAGATWTEINNGLFDLNVNALVVDPVNPNTVYAGTAGSSVFSFVNCPTITVNPNSLPGGNTGAGYSQSLSSTGGVNPVTFDVTAGLLPDGLSLSSAGVLSGTPTSGGSFNFTITATDANGCTGSRDYNVVITGCPAITLNPTSLSDAVVGANYNQVITATGATGTPTFEVTAGALPSGITLDADGTLSGTPTETGSFDFTVTATDANACTGSRAYTLDVVCPAITLNPTTVPGGTAGAAYSQSITATGVQPLVGFVLNTGDLPDGITLSSAGQLSGTPTETGLFGFSVRATDTFGCQGTRTYQLNIACPAMNLSPATLPDAFEGVSYSQNITSDAGILPISFDISAGSIPSGMSLSAQGQLSGAPGASGVFNFTARATDANGCIGTKDYSLLVNSCPAITVNPATLPDGSVNVAYSQNVTDTGGVDPVAFSVTTGILPPGLALTSNGILFGIPNTAGSFDFTITATDDNGCTGSRDYSVTIAGVCGTITVNPATLPDGSTTAAYNQTLTASGGTAPFSFVVNTGDLPDGLTLSNGGQITGTPTVEADFDFSVTATDSNSCAGSRDYTIHVSSIAILFSDDFEDGNANGWTFTKGDWTVVNGNLRGTFTKKADIISPFAAGCSECTITTDLKIETPGSRASLLGWFQDKKTLVELVAMDDKNIWQLKHKANGATVAKGKFAQAIDPGVEYRVVVSFSGSQFSVSVNNILLFTVNSPQIPAGTVGFRVKATAGQATVEFKSITVN